MVQTIYNLQFTIRKQFKQLTRVTTNKQALLLLVNTREKKIQHLHRPHRNGIHKIKQWSHIDQWLCYLS